MQPFAETVVQLAALISGTFVSEDLTTIAAGLLIRDGQVHWLVGLLGSFLGIYLGDLGLWLAGRTIGRRAVRFAWIERRLPGRRLEQFADWFDERGWRAVLASRFLPGTRLPLCLAAGVWGRKPYRFALWTLLAAGLWTPLLVLGTAAFGPVVVGPLEAVLGQSWLAKAVGGVGIFLGLLLARSLASPIGRAKWIARVSRLWRWEFWPSWLFYLPVVPWIGWLAVRYRSLTVWTSANPGIPQGGVVGESKFDILSRLPAGWTVPSELVSPGPAVERRRSLEAAIARRGWRFPLILKPDAAQRGAGVKLVRSPHDAARVLAETHGPVIAQTYHAGPYEAGIFYYRLPCEARGRIFSITDKEFARVTGDGRSTVEELIWRHPRYRMQAATFLARHAAERGRTPAAGEEFRLAIAGNHCQGTMFRDGGHFITPELERTVDNIARSFPGFHIGRFDVRYGDPAEFRAGRDLAIVELNGVTSESTNIYDPSRSLWSAYRVLYRQWGLLFQIGNANRRRGIQTVGVRELWRLVRDYYRQVRVNPLAD